MIDIGEHRLAAVLDSVVRPDPTALYTGIARHRWENHRDLLTPDGRLELFMGGYVLRSRERLVLIDAGVGPDGWTAPSGAEIPGGYLLDNLRVAGLAAEDFTDVVFTHLHPDHVGWATVDGSPTFPNATYRCHRHDWDHFVGPGAADDTVQSVLEPVASRLETWDAQQTLFPGVDVVPAAGHTPGSSIVVMSAPSGERAMLLGDVVHCPVELLEDEWETFGDVDKEMADAVRVRVARELEGSETLVGAAHFPELRFGRVLAGDSGRRWSAA